MTGGRWLEVSHPLEWNAFANAVIVRGELERKLGLYGGYGTVSYGHGCDVRFWPKERVEELAYAEEDVFVTQAALRRRSVR